jgi:hypothetical protein
MTAGHLVLVGACGWQHAAWRARFYPDDLPDDWQLSYYSTQFPAVYLTAPMWQNASAAEWQQWLAETHEGFVFALEPIAEMSPQVASARVVLATPDWADEHVCWADETPDLRALAQRITAHAATGEPLFVFSRSGDLARLEQARALTHVMGY